MSDLHWETAITKVEPNKLSIRGYALESLIGKASYAQLIYLLLKGEMPEEDVSKMIEAILISSVDHGTTPPSVLSALTVASTGASLNASVAAGILSISKFHGGAIEDCMHILHSAIEIKNNENLDFDGAAKEIIQTYRSKNKRMAGFGHRIHTNDPRKARLFSLAKEYGIFGNYCTMADTITVQLKALTGKALPLNVDGAIAALLCEMDFDPVLANGFFMIARVPGLIAHIYEELTRQKPMRKIHPTDVTYDGPEDRSV